MQSITLIYEAGGDSMAFTVVDAIPSFETEKENYTKLDFTRATEVRAAWKKWLIRFGYLTPTEQDFIAGMDIQPDPQVVINSITYDVEVKKIDAKAEGGSMEIINRSPE